MGNRRTMFVTKAAATKQMHLLSFSLKSNRSCAAASTVAVAQVQNVPPAVNTTRPWYLSLHNTAHRQSERSAYSSTSTKCPTCCECNAAEVLTAAQVQNVPPAVNTTQQKCLHQHKYKMSHLLWIQPGHGRNTAQRQKSTYTVLVDLLLGFSLGFSSSGMGGISSSTLPFSSIPISASVRLASQLWVFFSVSSFSWSGRKNTVKHCLSCNMLSVHTVWEREREIVRACVCLWLCVCVCACVHVPVCACLCAYVHECCI